MRSPRPGFEWETIGGTQSFGTEGDWTVGCVSQTGSTNVRCSTYKDLDRRAIAKVQRRIAKQGERSAVSRAFRSKNDKDNIDAWGREFNRILQIFNVRLVNSTWCFLVTSFQTELAINTHTLVVDIHRSVLEGQKGTVHQHQSVSTAPPESYETLIVL